MSQEYVDPSVFNSRAPPSDGVDFSSYLHDAGGDLADGLSWGNFMENFSTPTLPTQQSYQNAGAAAQQQLMNTIPVVDITDERYTTQLGHPYDAGNSFPFPLQEAPQNVGTPNTAPSTSRSPESTPQYNDSPFTNNTTSPEATPQPPKPAPKKRGRKPRVVASKAEEDRLRQKFLERNRIAASKCREKKKGATEKMQNDVHFLKNQNDTLKINLELLKGELRDLRNIMQPHDESNCKNHPTVLAALGRRDQKLAARQKPSANQSTNKPMDLDGMSYETERDEVDTKEARKTSVGSAVDLSTPTQPFSARKVS